MKGALVLLLVGCGSSAAVAPDGAAGGGGDTATTAPDVGSAPADTAPGPSDTGKAGPDLGMAMTGKTIDECFAGLRPLVGAFQDATHASADGKYLMRLALETDGRGGTSGSYAWAAVRVALQSPEGSLCLTDEAALASLYKGSHHNCMDSLTITSGNTRYDLANPDSAADYGNKTVYRRQASLIVTRDGVRTPTVALPTTKCNTSDRSDGACFSGGPCQ